ncbi:MAG: hypothetical protein IJV50_01650 [Lachnospiraceae bacterium]|nr:hypothetical protein [Lachnospiraceae bacterium]
MNLKRTIQGSVSVLLIIILVPMLVLSGLVVDTSRVNMARAMVSGAGDLAMNSALADYDTVLKDVYGLFAMSQTDADFEKNIQKYFEQTLISYGVVDEENAGEYTNRLLNSVKDFIGGSTDQLADFMSMELVGDVSVEKLDQASLAKADVMRTQIVDYMKYRGPLTFGLSFFDSIKAFTSVEKQTEVVEKQVKAQESTQDVTSACAALIKAIREYDKLVDEMKDVSSDQSVKGAQNSEDGVLVSLSEYGTQVGKYRSDYGSNYEHINKLAMIFLLYKIDVSNLILGNMFSSGVLSMPFTPYIERNGNEYTFHGDASGFKAEDMNLALSDDLNQAKEDFDNGQKLFVNAGGNPIGAFCKNVKDEYTEGRFFASIGNASWSGDVDITNHEDTLIQEFVAFEEFIDSSRNMELNPAEVTLQSVSETIQNSELDYVQVYVVLQLLFELSQYYDNYVSVLQSKKAEAEQELNEATQNWNQAKTKAQQYEAVIEEIKTKTEQMKSGYQQIRQSDPDSTGLYENWFQGEETDPEIASRNTGVVNELKLLFSDSLQLEPYTKSEIGDRTFYNIAESDGYVRNLKQYAAQSNSRFESLLEFLSETSLQQDDTYGKICTDTKVYLSSGTTQSYDAYMNSRLSSVQKNSAVYELFSYLAACDANAKKVISGVSDYNEVKNGYQELYDTYREKNQIVNNLEQSLQNVKIDYNNCLSQYASFTTNYQYDLYYYDKYLKAAENQVEKEVKDVHGQFQKIQGNIQELLNKLSEIETKASEVETQIQAYQQKVNEWKFANDSYKSSTGEDTFAQQNDTEIETTKTQYNLDAAKKLHQYITAVKNGYNALNDYLLCQNAPDTYLSYAGKTLNQLDSADAVVKALKGYASANLNVLEDIQPVVKPDQNIKVHFNDLYPSTEAPKLDFQQKDKDSLEVEWQEKFLDPTVKLTFLGYLNGTFPDEAVVTEDESEQTEKKPTKKEIKEEYEATKEEMKKEKNPASSEDNEESGGGGFGYVYDTRGSIVSSDLPSSGIEKNAVQTANYKLEEKDGKLNASNGVSAQTSALKKVLKGIGNVAATGLENVYILGYIFENFSYNTLVQEKVLAGEFDARDSKTYLAVKQKLKEDDILSRYRGTAETLSGYGLNGETNYLYGGEVEYILYGNKENPKANVQYAKTSIYAIRFAFDCIYAFTNADIRNSTRAAGMMVQSATFGVVPYQVVQIVLQLALAAGEAAIDLDMIMNGMDVAIVKTEDTWVISGKGMAREVNDYVNDYKQILEKDIKTAIEQEVGEKIEQVRDGIKKVTESSSEQLAESVNELSHDLNRQVENTATEILDSMILFIESKIDSALNNLQYDDSIGYENIDEVRQYVRTQFATIRGNINTDLKNKFGGNTIGDLLLPKIQERIDGALNEVETQIDKKLGELQQQNADLRTAVNQTLNDIKTECMSPLDTLEQNIVNGLGDTLSGITDEISTQMGTYFQKASVNINQMTDEAAETLKKEIQQKTNEWYDRYLKNGNGVSTIGTGLDTVAGNAGNQTANSSLGAKIKFGYKDYLMLFMFLSLCTDKDDTILCRTADVIQLNMQHAGGDGASFTHKKGSDFRMKNANTYVSITANAKLKMLFLNLDWFQEFLVSEDSTETIDDQFGRIASIQYKGLYGY